MCNAGVGTQCKDAKACRGRWYAPPAATASQDDYDRLFEHARELARENAKLREGSPPRPTTAASEAVRCVNCGLYEGQTNPRDACTGVGSTASHNFVNVPPRPTEAIPAAAARDRIISAAVDLAQAVRLDQRTDEEQEEICLAVDAWLDGAPRPATPQKRDP